ncbi:MAG TPA: DUF6427 family protein [Bacteroidales bacterium]|nr:DUF6427 family protein [Bacteroidales bacterium]
MIKLLRSNNPANYVLMFALMLVFWAFKIIFMPTDIENFESYNLLFKTLPETIFFKYLVTICGFVVVFLFSLLINKTNSELLIVKSAYQSPGMFFVILSGAYINSQRLTPILIASMLLFLSILILMHCYQKYKAFDNCFNSGLVFSLGVLIFPKLIFFFPLLVFVLFYIKPVQLRELLVFIMGVFTPTTLYFSALWLYGDLNSAIIKLETIFSQTFSSGRYSLFFALVLLNPIIWAIITIIAKYLYNPSNKVSTRKFQTIIVILVLYFVILYISSLIENEAIVVLFAPLCFLFSNIVINAGKNVSLFFLYGLLISIFVSQFFQISFYLSMF